MKREEVLNLHGGELPVLLKDGCMGLLTVYPGTGDRCGVQVHGEEEHRWMPSAELEHLGGGALVQVGAPAYPQRPKEMVQALLAMDWATRGAAAVVERIDRAKQARQT